MTEKNPLVGRVITEIALADDAGAIRFVLSDGEEIIARCDGDCCSHTWIEDVLDAEAAVGAEVLRAEDVDLPEHLRAPTKTDNYEEEMAYYGFVIDTAKGRFTIAYRNSSNGYYGGSLEWPNGYFYGGVYGQNVSKERWRVLASAPMPGAVDPIGELAKRDPSTRVRAQHTETRGEE